MLVYCFTVVISFNFVIVFFCCLLFIVNIKLCLSDGSVFAQDMQRPCSNIYAFVNINFRNVNYHILNFNQLTCEICVIFSI